MSVIIYLSTSQCQVDGGDKESESPPPMEAFGDTQRSGALFLKALACISVMV